MCSTFKIHGIRLLSDVSKPSWKAALNNAGTGLYKKCRVMSFSRVVQRGHGEPLWTMHVRAVDPVRLPLEQEVEQWLHDITDASLFTSRFLNLQQHTYRIPPRSSGEQHNVLVAARGLNLRLLREPLFSQSDVGRVLFVGQQSPISYYDRKHETNFRSAIMARSVWNQRHNRPQMDVHLVPKGQLALERVAQAALHGDRLVRHGQQMTFRRLYAQAGEPTLRKIGALLDGIVLSIHQESTIPPEALARPSREFYSCS